MTLRVRPTVLCAAVAAVVAAAAPLAAQSVVDELRIIAPAAPGGGWDQTARAMQQALQRAGLVRLVPVENVSGAAGTIGLARFIGNESGRSGVVMVSGLIMLGGIVTQRSPVTLHEVTPLARLTGEYEVIAVPTASPYRSLRDLLDAFLARPESISWAGGSEGGGGEQMLAGLVADALGVAPSRVNYIAFSGGGESMPAILGGQVSVGINGLAEFAPQIDAGTLRPLAISSAVRLPGVNIPTLREQGVDVEFENWRALMAPPGITAADRTRLDGVIAAMVRSPEWREVLARYRWLDRYLAGEPFDRFVQAEEARVRDVLGKLGFGGWLKSIVPHMDMPLPMKIVMYIIIFPIELAGLFIKHFILAVRLLANMMAGHLVLAVIVGFIAAASGSAMVYAVAPASILGSVALSLLELFVAFLQAYIFTFLSALFIGMAVHPH
jgi:putative tricarboxylic transport membrane protein